ncbi:MAG: aminotransferase class I/II-fold pyridoxal phosphate-dependent enzyme [Sphingobacteriaceae bacterium]|nr:aminotransferase class I/II-fold pyridoxal phosphate-dependent enzyme [Sphingobacteriaceae bacterium]
MQVSHMADQLIGSEIIKLAGEINQKIKAGANIYNFTIGDFDPKVFPIPAELNTAIQQAYAAGHTNYPAANGVTELRESVRDFMHTYGGLDYAADDYLIAGGARPLIYAIYQTLLDPGDKVVYAVPSWNNNHYCHLSRAQGIELHVGPAENFMPSAAQIAPYIQEATLVAVCSPLNPTGTVFGEKELAEICDLILAENKRRGPDQKPVYLMYDQIYWMLTFGSTQHFDPVSLRPEMRAYTIFVDGLSKAFAATGVRVGWTFGPRPIIDKMKAILGHVGAWAPKAEQVAVAQYLRDGAAVDRFLSSFKSAVHDRLDGFYQGFMRLKAAGHPVDCIAPQAAIYLTIQLHLLGKTTPAGKQLNSTRDITAFVLEAAGLAVVPFYAFGASESSTWYRLSVGTCKAEEVQLALASLEKALVALK